jgi:hypothetical protein
MAVRLVHQYLTDAGVEDSVPSSSRPLYSRSCLEGSFSELRAYGVPGGWHGSGPLLSRILAYDRLRGPCLYIRNITQRRNYATQRLALSGVIDEPVRRVRLQPTGPALGVHPLADEPRPF